MLDFVTTLALLKRTKWQLVQVQGDQVRFVPRMQPVNIDTVRDFDPSCCSTDLKRTRADFLYGLSGRSAQLSFESKC